MRKIYFKEPTTKEWKQWRKKCDERTRNLIKRAKKKKKIEKGTLYKKQRNEYTKKDGAFHGKCAYCESELEQYNRDLDHFRPAGSPTTEDDKKIKHPGYYWLINDWTNLLPACNLCNKPGGEKEYGRKIGKHSRFPVRNNYYGQKPGEEKFEKRLLIHPVRDFPEKHFEFDLETSRIFGKTKKGETCIKIFGFYERGKLRDDWIKACREVRNDWANTLRPETKDPEKIRKRIAERIKSGKDEFSFVKLAILRDIKEAGDVI